MVAILLTVTVAVGVFLEKEMSQLTAVAACWDGQLGLAIGFYYWKAKNENRSKYAMKLVKDLAGKYEFESVINLANVILKD